MSDPKLDDDRDGRRLARLAAILRQELDELEALLPAALDAQWTPGVVHRAEQDPGVRVKGQIHRPTEDAALDGRRLALRAQILRSGDLLADSITKARGIRRGLERALTRWEGDVE